MEGKISFQSMERQRFCVNMLFKRRYLHWSSGEAAEPGNEKPRRIHTGVFACFIIILNECMFGRSVIGLLLFSSLVGAVTKMEILKVLSAGT